jgi:hypothetical protein
MIDRLAIYVHLHGPAEYCTLFNRPLGDGTADPVIAAAKTVTTCPEETKVPFSPFEITTSAELPGIPTVIPEMIRLLFTSVIRALVAFPVPAAEGSDSSWPICWHC